MLPMEVEEGGNVESRGLAMTAHWINRVHYVHVALAFTTDVPDTRPHGGGELQIIISTVNHNTYWWVGF